MLPRVRFGKTGLSITRIAVGGYPFGGVNRARGWDPFTPAGRSQAIETIRTALGAGINLVDTAPGYGDGNSESIVGEALGGCRGDVVLATKVGYGGTAADVRESVEKSLGRLRTDVIDVIQFHGGAYTAREVAHILDDGLLSELETLRTEGKVRFLGFTAEEPWTARPLIASGAFDVMQVRYNVIYQVAAIQVLDLASAVDLGISVMRPMPRTRRVRGILQRMATYVAPEWAEATDLYGVCLKFVLSDSRVHVANVGMRWPEEVERNVALASSFSPAFDTADLPRTTAHIYRTYDEVAGLV